MARLARSFAAAAEPEGQHQRPAGAATARSSQCQTINTDSGETSGSACPPGEKHNGHGVRADRHRRCRGGCQFAHAHKRAGTADQVDRPDASGIRQRNCHRRCAGDWINCDFGTPINIQPVEWRAWHGHSPQPQSLKVNTRGRLARPQRGHRSAKQSTPTAVKTSGSACPPGEKHNRHGVRARRHRRCRGGCQFAHAHKRLGAADDRPDAGGVRERNCHRRCERPAHRELL